MNSNTFVHEWVNAYNNQDFDGFGAMCTDDVTYDCGPFGHAFTGRDALVSHIREYAAAVPDRKLTPKRVIANGDVIAVEYDFAGTSSGAVPGLPPAGQPISISFCTILQLRDGRIASQVDYLGGQ